jgi:hypothetical protein
MKNPPGELTLLALGLAILFAGCSQPKFYPTRGEVTLYGVGKLTEGEVRFRPVSKPSLVATGQIGKDGRFSLSTEGHGEGVLEGDVEVAVIVAKGGKRQIAERYADYSTSDIRYTILPRDENYFMLEVRK